MKKTIFILSLLFSSLSIILAQQSKMTTANINLRDDANINSNIITIIPKGTTVEIIENCDCEWIPVSYNGKIGYIYSKYIQFYPQNKIDKITEHSGEIKYYKNKNGIKVQSPTYYSSAPEGATALCRDGTYSFSRNRRGTCSHHGGVAKWLK